MCRYINETPPFATSQQVGLPPVGCDGDIQVTIVVIIRYGILELVLAGGGRFQVPVIRQGKLCQSRKVGRLFKDHLFCPSIGFLLHLPSVQNRLPSKVGFFRKVKIACMHTLDDVTRPADRDEDLNPPMKRVFLFLDLQKLKPGSLDFPTPVKRLNQVLGKGLRIQARPFAYFAIPLFLGHTRLLAFHWGVCGWNEGAKSCTRVGDDIARRPSDHRFQDRFSKTVFNAKSDMFRIPDRLLLVLIQFCCPETLRYVAGTWGVRPLP